MQFYWYLVCQFHPFFSAFSYLCLQVSLVSLYIINVNFGLICYLGGKAGGFFVYNGEGGLPKLGGRCSCGGLEQVQVKKTVRAKAGDRELIVLNENGTGSQLTKGIRAPTIRRSKLLIVDLAGSERVDKSGPFLSCFHSLASSLQPLLLCSYWVSL
jgi:hypothetical protein